MKLLTDEWQVVAPLAIKDGFPGRPAVAVDLLEDGGVLAQVEVLDELEDAGLVSRRVEDRPLATYYSLSESGQQLAPVFDELEQWADQNLQISLD